MIAGRPVPARGHIPFPGHRTCAETRPESVTTDLFMEAVSEHGDVPLAASAVGKTAEWGERQLAAYAGRQAA